jgi:cytochrome c oxidase cbb3-type subunit 4
MDINLLRGLVTVVLFALFVGVCIWAWSARRCADFDAAAQMPLEPDADGPRRQGE